MQQYTLIGTGSTEALDAGAYRDLFLQFAEDFERLVQSKDSPESVVDELRQRAAFAARHFREAEQLPGEVIPRGILNAPGILLSEWWLAPRPDGLPIPFTHGESEEPSEEQILAWSRVWVTILRNIATTYPKLLKGGEEVGGTQHATDFEIRAESREQFARSSAEACRVIAGWLSEAEEANGDDGTDEEAQPSCFSLGDVLAIADAVKDLVSHTELDDLLGFGASDDPGSSHGKVKRLRAVLQRCADSLEGRSQIVTLIENIASARRLDDRLAGLCQEVNGIIAAHGLRLDLDCKVRSQQVKPPRQSSIPPIRSMADPPLRVELVGVAEEVRDLLGSRAEETASGKQKRRAKRTHAQIVEDEGKIAGFLIDNPEATRDQTAAGTGIAQAHVSAAKAWRSHREQRK